MLEGVVRYIQQSPEASAQMHADSSDPVVYLSLTETAARRERLRLHMAEDPGVVLASTASMNRGSWFGRVNRKPIEASA
ncbi:hypothetical protein ACFCX0_46905 [Streptomyces sp. NPDC056352]|uniref:hypothetical protein n=1 Tax=Streptomyces sp. NPDC056352 TaxID=3345791 RepID=UPI0035DF25EB